MVVFVSHSALENLGMDHERMKVDRNAIDCTVFWFSRPNVIDRTCLIDILHVALWVDDLEDTKNRICSGVAKLSGHQSVCEEPQQEPFHGVGMVLVNGVLNVPNAYVADVIVDERKIQDRRLDYDSIIAQVEKIFKKVEIEDAKLAGIPIDNIISL